ncbi:MAG: hypothetical protein ABWW66_03815 [Archaeoglobaceae archaeon]
MSKAVSEVLGYIYIFGIVMTVLAIVFVQVNSMVDEFRRSVMSESLEQSFKRIQYIIHSVAFGEVPAQSVEMELQGGTLNLEEGDPEFILAFVNYSNPATLQCGEGFTPACLNLTNGEVSLSGSCSGSYNYSACVVSREVGRLTFSERGKWGLSIEAGSVFSRYYGQDYSRLLYEPRILYNATIATGSSFLVMTIPILEGNLSASGAGWFRFLVEEGEYSFTRVDLRNLAGFDDIYVIIRDTENGDAWCRFFDRHSGHFNTSLDFSLTAHTSCYTAWNPTVKLKQEVLSELVVIFKTVRFKEVG